MDFVSRTSFLDFPQTHKKATILVFIEILSKMLPLVAVPKSITALSCVRGLVEIIVPLHGLPCGLVSIRNRVSRLSSGATRLDH